MLNADAHVIQDHMKISEWVKNKRLSLGQNQKEFGFRFGLSHAAISDMERGKVKHISEDMLNFILQGCEHRVREYRKTYIAKCKFCGFEEETNIKEPPKMVLKEV